MKNDLYFKHDVGASNNRKLMHLIDDLGMKGYGTYWLIQESLRMQQNYQAPLTLINRLARRARVMPAFVRQVIENYDLFVVTETCFYSPGMARRMRAYDLKMAPTLHEEVPLESLNSLRDCENTLPNAHVRREDKREERREEEEERGGGEKLSLRLTPLQVRNFANGVNYWERYIDQAFDDTAWLEVVAMHSGMGMEFIRRLEEIRAFFKRHVRTYGKEPTVCSVADAKSYFGNFIRQGTPTLQALQAELFKHQARQKENDPYRYEERDPQTGERIYCGQLIPPDAPPRPSENAVWSNELHEWSA